jgi:hypothetical protein
MSGYNAATEVYYCKQSENPGSVHRIAPAPTIVISPEIYYANDSVIGYTYVVTLNGYANALRKEKNAGSIAFGADKTIQHMGDIRDIFNTNGGNLYIKQNNANVIVAKGATIKNITYNPSENRWVNYSPFTIELEFNEIDFIGCENNSTIQCNNSFFNASSLSSNLVDINKYKIKDFSDKWSFTIDNEIYQNYDATTNNLFRVSYNLSATGKNFYINDKLIPAWQQAKMFVQDRLFSQVRSLINGVLQIEQNNKDGCSASKSLDQLHDTDLVSPRSGGLISNGNTLRDGNANYDVYNESINCSTSEADGSFSVTYNAILKKNDPALNPSENAALHTYTKNTTTTNNPKNVTINVQGNIQGLVRGGFIYYNNDFDLPNSGSFISTIDSAETKYSNALAYFNSKIGDGSDLLGEFKEELDITAEELLINTDCPGDSDDDEPPRASSFTTDHSYTEGVVGYNASYDTNTANTVGRNLGYSNVSIVRNDPVEIIQEFVIPGRIQGPIIQRLGMKTSRTISINIEGADERNRECVVFCDDENNNFFDPCDSLPTFDIKGFETLLQQSESWIKTREDYTKNVLDGSYSISLEYTCKG